MIHDLYNENLVYVKAFLDRCYLDKELAYVVRGQLTRSLMKKAGMARLSIALEQIYVRLLTSLFQGVMVTRLQMLYQNSGKKDSLPSKIL